MSFKSLMLLAMLGLSQAKPAPKVIGYDDVLLIGEDGPVVMKDYDYKLALAKRNVKRRKAARDAAASRLNSGPPAGQQKRGGCEESTEIQILEDDWFEDWDVAMSPVIGNTGSVNALIAITKGYQLADTVTVSETVEAKLTEVFSTSLSISYAHQWTTQDSQAFTFYVPPGQNGAIITNPLNHRIAGNTLSGCTDSPTNETYVVNSYSTQDFGDMTWVQGRITVCNSTAYPVPFCVGTGEHR